MLTTIARPAATITAVLGMLALSACGDDDGPEARPTASDELGDVDDAREDLADAQEDSGVPEECAGAFPLAWGEPDLADAALPAGWPDPPAGAVLCAVSDDTGSVQTVDYATDQDAVAVLDHYASALAGVEGYDVAREEPPGLGHEVVSGTAGDDGGFQVDPRDGGFRIAVDIG
ncbi:hypothetical protein [Nocardioides humi]|uniref:Uncharacterized protein n=1 Tax=Nocardioides humi TaxID=449461 RepID=A0ABN2AF23_9ACTN|nr:hypothetical protein [Nocardioides humi]